MNTPTVRLEPKRKYAGEHAAELDFHCSGFIVQVQGDCRKPALAQFQHFLNARGLFPTNDELLSAIERAKEDYLRGQSHLFVCGAHPCCNAVQFDAGEETLCNGAQCPGLQISKTGCQGQCKHAPIISLRVANQTQMLARVVTGEDRRSILDFAKSAVEAGTLLIDPAEAAPFLHDPAHDHGRVDAHLQPLRFLLGHFRGKGRVAKNEYTFDKEVAGTLEAGGRFIGLRMSATYPRANGIKDVHKALVIVGSPSSRQFKARAFTDGGIAREYDVEQQEESLQFADIPPDHSRRWKRARKVLRPIIEGFEEILEADAGDGFVPYYTIKMLRISAHRSPKPN